MKAAYFMQNGAPEVMQYGELPDPVAGSGQVLIEIHAASVNAADWKTRVGYRQPTTTFPFIPGRDFSGVIKALGPDVNDLAVGDEVFGVTEQTGARSYAELIAINAAIVSKKPKAISHIEAAAVGLIGLTATIAIENTLQLKSGETILIQGGAGGVASFAVQLSKHIGAHVISTTSAINRDYVLSLGADEVIDYNQQDFTTVILNCDAAFDTVGGNVAIRTLKVLRPGGRAAFIDGAAPKSERSDIQALKPNVERKRVHLDHIAKLITSGAVRVPEIKTYSLTEAAAAHRVSEGRHFRGKLVFKIR